MEDLTKNQLILLALLVSFVTSIATGVATVSLLDQAPPKVNQVINRVVERTVEKVVPGDTTKVVTKEETIVVKEEDLVIESVAKTDRALVRVFVADGDNLSFSTLGFVISSEGVIVVPFAVVSDSTIYNVRFSDGRERRAQRAQVVGESAVGFLTLLSSDGSENKKEEFASLALGDTKALQLGQTVFAVGGEQTTTVSTGVIARLEKAEVTDEGEDIQTILSRVHTTIPNADLSLGTPLINLFGEVIGIVIARSDGFLPAGVISRGFAGLGVES